MGADTAGSPRYDLETVERTMLEEILRRHPQRLTVAELSLLIVADPADDLEVETAKQAASNLRSAGLVRYRNDDEIVEPTYAALRARALLTGVAPRRTTH